MLNFVAKRLLIALPVLAGILVLSFVLLRLLPGDPVTAMIPPDQLADTPPEYLDQLRTEMGLDKPLLAQFGDWIAGLVQLDLGESFQRHEPVIDVLANGLLPSALLAGTSIVVALCIGITFGVISALRQNTLADRSIAVTSMLIVSVPTFFMGVVVLYLFAVKWAVLPAGGMEFTGGGGVALHLILPVIVLASHLAGPYIRYVRQSMLDVLREDFLTTARAKGVAPFGVVAGHGLRNALVPLTTVVGAQIPELISGLVIIEIIFAWPGLGTVSFDAVASRDLPVLSAIILFGAVLVLVCNLVADLLAAALDPRIRL